MTSLNCSYVPGEILADGDIVGPGVLLAFFLSALATVLAVIFAYISDSLDKDYFNELDRSIIATVKRKWRHHIRRIHTDLSKDVQKEADAVRQARMGAVTQFILTLSDQQFVTGFAILLAGISDPVHITGYEFNVVTSLAWLSSTTHLATLTVLRGYMKEHDLVRHAREIGMVLVLLLLWYAMLTEPFDYNTLPMECILSNMSEASKAEGGPIVYPIYIASNIFALLELSIQYMIRFQEAYLGEQHPSYFPVLLYWKMTKFSTGDLSFSEYFAELLAERRLVQLVKRLAAPDTNGRLVQRLRHTLMPTIGYYYRLSFLSSIPGLAFSFAYGVAQVVAYRWFFAPPLETGTNRMAFGQIVPLLLLLLPVLTAIEAYKEYRDRDRHDPVAASDTTQRKQTASTASAADDDATYQDLVRIGQNFDGNLVHIEQLFSREVRVRIKEASHCTHEEILLRKRDLLRRYQLVMAAMTRDEASLDRTIRLLFTVSLILSVSTAIALVIPQSSLYAMLILAGLTSLDLSATIVSTRDILNASAKTDRDLNPMQALRSLCLQSRELMLIPTIPAPPRQP